MLWVEADFLLELWHQGNVLFAAMTSWDVEGRRNDKPIFHSVWRLLFLLYLRHDLPRLLGWVRQVGQWSAFMVHHVFMIEELLIVNFF